MTRFESERNEGLERPERSGESGDLREQLREGLECLREGVARGEDFDHHASELVNEIAEVAVERFELIREFASLLAEVAQAVLEQVAPEWAERFQQAMTEVSDFVEKGEAAFRENPEAARAVCELLVLAAFVLHSPEEAGRLLATRPELLTDRIDAILTALGSDEA